MNNRRNENWHRREFLERTSVLGAASLLGLRAAPAAAEPPPETTRLRVPWVPSTCRSPEWVAEELLRAEGFTEVTYVMKEGTQGMARALASGEADIGGHFAAPVILRLEADRKSTRLNSSHGYISYAVFCLKKKKNRTTPHCTLRFGLPPSHHCRGHRSR